jgi:hypothetical protein
MGFRGYEPKTGRKRRHSVSFRMSDEELAFLNQLVEISGLTKQQYMINKSLDREIIVVGNIKTYKNLRNYILELTAAINKYIQTNNTLDEYNVLLLLHIAEILKGLNNERNQQTIIKSRTDI